MDEHSDKSVDETFALAVNKLFETLRPHCPLLTALLCRAQDDSPWSSDYLFAYIRTMKLNDSGQSTHEVVSIEPHMLKHHEPCSDILDMDDRIVTTNA